MTGLAPYLHTSRVHKEARRKRMPKRGLLAEAETRADSLKNIPACPPTVLLQLPQADKRKFAKYK